MCKKARILWEVCEKWCFFVVRIFWIASLASLPRNDGLFAHRFAELPRNDEVARIRHTERDKREVSKSNGVK